MFQWRPRTRTPEVTVPRKASDLTRIYVCWTCVIEDVIQCLTDFPRTCPELRVLRVKVTSDTCDRVFGSVLVLCQRRHTTKRPHHSVECAIGEGRTKGALYAIQNALKIRKWPKVTGSALLCTSRSQVSTSQKKPPRKNWRSEEIATFPDVLHDRTVPPG